MKPTDIAAPDYFHKVVDCQWACPAHTPVPEYIRLIAAGRYSDAYMINWKSNVFPGILGRTCDRPCEPACRRGRVEKEPVAICRLKRVAADFKDDIRDRLPKPAAQKNGKRIALVGGGPASLTVARDLAPLGYDCVGVRPGPAGRRHDAHADPEIPPAGIGDRRGMRLHPRPRHRVRRRQAHRQPEGAAGGRLRRDLRRLRRAARPRPRHPRPQGSGEEHPYRHRLAVVSVSFGHIDKIGKRVIVLGGGNTAMDCCRSSRRLGGEDVKVIVRSGFEEMKASPWEKEDAMHEDIPILNFLVPKEFTHDNGKLTGVAVREGQGRMRRQGPPQAGADRRAGPAFPLRRRAGRGRPGERLPLDRARRRHRVRQMGHAQGRSQDHGLDQPEGVLRRRRRVRPEEHHLGGGARPRRRALDPQDAVAARTSPSARRRRWRSPARRWASTSGATTTTSRSTSATGCRIATR